MKLQMHGKNISEIEILNISPSGIWLLVQNNEFFLPYKDYPWFRNAKISQIYNLQFLYNHHLYWPELDVDIELSSINNLEKYPLIYKCNRKKVRRGTLKT